MMVALVTHNEVLARLGRPFTAEENIRIDTLIADVTSAVRGDIGQQITEGTTTDAILRADGRHVHLPQRPVTAITTVTDIVGNALTYTWFVGDTRLELGSSWYLNVWELNVPTAGRHQRVLVTYDHGYVTVPDDIVAAVCAIVIRGLTVTPADPQVVQESIAGYSYTLRSDTATGPFGISDNERTILDRYKRPTAPISLLQ